MASLAALAAHNKAAQTRSTSFRGHNCPAPPIAVWGYRTRSRHLRTAADLLRSQVLRFNSAMSGISRERALWLSTNVLPHEPAVRSWLASRRVAALEVDDVIQESYAKLAAIESVESIRNPKSYFFQTAYSILITQIRRSRVVSITAVGELDLLSVPSEEPLPDRQLEDRDQLREIAAAIASLPRSCREVFLLRRVHGLSQREVAKRLRLSENTVEHHMTRSIRLLMDVFGRGGKLNPQSSVVSRDRPASIRNDTPGNKWAYRCAISAGCRRLTVMRQRASTMGNDDLVYFGPAPVFSLEASLGLTFMVPSGSVTAMN